MRFTSASFFALASVALSSFTQASPIEQRSGTLSIRQNDAAQINNFCARYNQACVSVCLQGAAVGSSNQVTLACTAYGDSFNFGCKCGSGKTAVDRSQQALTKLGGLSTRTSTYSTKTVTSKTTVKPTTTTTTTTSTTGSATYTLKHSTTTTPRVTSTYKTTTTTTSLSVVPTTYTSIYTSVISYTALTTVPETSVTVLNQPIATTLPYPVVEVALTSLSSRSTEGDVKRATDVLCTNYFDSCARECARVGSTPKTQVCTRTSSTTFSYKLGCMCKNGIQETRHALAGISESVQVVSTIAVATATATITQMQTVTSTITDAQTITFLTETTASFTTTATDYESTTSTSVSLTTFSPGTTSSTTTYKPIATSTATSTTIQVIAPTGVLRVRRSQDDSSIGYADISPNSGAPIVLDTSSSAKSSADSFMLVRDVNSNSGLYQLRKSDLSDARTMACELAGSTDSTFSGTSSNYCQLEALYSTQTTAGPASNSPAGNFNQAPVESFNWYPQIARISGVGNGAGQLKVFPRWINPNGNAPAAGTFMVRGGTSLFMTSDRTDLRTKIGVNAPNAIDVSPLYFAFEAV